MSECLRRLRAATVASALIAAIAAHADGAGIDAIDHPYVQPLERQIELELLQADADDARDGRLWRIGYGQTLAPRLFAAGYLIGDQPHDAGLQVSGYEAEALWQLTEQGEYSSDWAVQTNLECPRLGDAHAATVELIGERQWDRWVGTVNASAGYQWGHHVSDNTATRLALQTRYRYSAGLEPAIEFFAGRHLLAAGPALLGSERLGPGRRVHWEIALATGLDRASPDLSLRGKLEYEF